MKKRLDTALALLCSAALVGTGLVLGQGRQVLAKAVHVCLECIGVG